MKGILNMSCTSQYSTAIISSNMELLSSASSSTSPSCSSGTSSFTPGCRAIDRHNPIITDEKRRGSASAPTTPCANIHPIKPTAGSLKPHQQHNPKRSRKLLGRKHKNAPKPTSTRDDDDDNDEKRKNVSKPSDLLTKAACTVARPGTNCISPPESSRYLLDDPSSFIEVLSNFDPVLKLVPKKPTEIEVSDPKLDAPSKAPTPPLSRSSSGSSDQVVVLRVSLHCRGCERKMKKHLSRMAGVTSFNIDFAAKKVTVVGDVTPLQVLASISKVKNAQLWTPAMSSPYPINSKSMEGWK